MARPPISTSTLSARFASRGAAERAVEHLVQEHAIDRAAIAVAPARRDNSSGTRASGADAAPHPDEGSALPPVLQGPIEVSVDLDQAEIEKAEAALRAAGAIDILQE